MSSFDICLVFSNNKVLIGRRWIELHHSHIRARFKMQLYMIGVKEGWAGGNGVKHASHQSSRRDPDDGGGGARRARRFCISHHDGRRRGIRESLDDARQ